MIGLIRKINTDSSAQDRTTQSVRGNRTRWMKIRREERVRWRDSRHREEDESVSNSPNRENCECRPGNGRPAAPDAIPAPLSQRRKTVYSRNTAIIKKDVLYFVYSTEERTAVKDVLKSIRDLFTMLSTCVVKEPSKEHHIRGNKEVTTEDKGRTYTHTNTTVSEGPSLRVLSDFSTVGSPDVVCRSHILQPPGGNVCNHSRVFWDCQ